MTWAGVPACGKFLISKHVSYLPDSCYYIGGNIDFLHGRCFPQAGRPRSHVNARANSVKEAPEARYMNNRRWSESAANAEPAAVHNTSHSPAGAEQQVLVSSYCRVGMWQLLRYVLTG